MKNKLIVLFISLLVISLSVIGLIKKDETYSLSERRNLTSIKDLKKDLIYYFENYAADQFPMRNTFRSIKAYTSKYIFNNGDNNGYFIEGDYVSKMDDKLNYKHLNSNLKRFESIIEDYHLDNIYLSIIPDKNYFMNHPTYDYDELVNLYKIDKFKYIDIFNELELSDYYYTDQHLKQEEVINLAQKILNAMGKDLYDKFDIKELDLDFYGTYSGQIALRVKPDKIKYLENEIINNLLAKDYQNKEIAIYDFNKAYDKDPYEFFMSGNNPIVKITNNKADNDDILIIFRDSFSSSIGTILATSYKNTILVDLRLVNSKMLGEYIDFDNADVLFLYSTLILNGVS